MAKHAKTSDAVEILRHRFIKGDPAREVHACKERANAEIACLVYELRKQTGLTQKQLAELVGTTQSVISRLEDADYEGHSLSTLRRIAEALNQRLTVTMTAKDQEPEVVRYVFQDVIRNLRRERGLTIDQLAEELELDRGEILAMERTPGYRPFPLTLHKLSKFYEIPEKRIAELAGAIKPTENLRERASRFAAQSESFSELTAEERRLLDEFVNSLRRERG